MGTWGRLWEAQKRLGAFFRADPKSLFLRQNVTEAMNAFILGIPLPMGSEILLSDLEYQAVENICRYRAERDGLTLRKFHVPVPEAGRMTPKEFADLVASELRPETGLLVLSHVFTGNGMVLPIAEIAARAREQGVLFAVDGAHAAGALDLDFGVLENVDFYGTNLHKWMLGPKGTGFGWVSPRHHEALRPLEAGWATFESPNDYKAFGDGARFPARFLMQGCRNFGPFFAIEEIACVSGRSMIPRKYARPHPRAAGVPRARGTRAKLGWPLLPPPLDGRAKEPADDLLSFLRSFGRGGPPG